MKRPIRFAILRAAILCALLPAFAVGLQANDFFVGTFNTGPLLNETASLTLETSGTGSSTILDGLTLELSDASAIGFSGQTIFTDSGANARPAFSASFDTAGDLSAINVIFSYLDDSFLIVNFVFQDPSVNNNQFTFEVESGLNAISSADMVPIPEPGQAGLALGILALALIGSTRRARP